MKILSLILMGVLTFVLFGTSISVLALQDTISTPQTSALLDKSQAQAFAHNKTYFQMLHDDCILADRYICLNTRRGQ